uniref:RING-CH-type domain-containing protein n=1 Tax=Rhabditophanes sp. KR3021 TaxID=114890 RepID=A0AC35U584_9BILA
MDVEEVIDITPRNEEICRICLSGEEKGAFDNNSLYGRSLITSCNCRGNTGRYHRSCVQIWLSNQSKEADSCEICGAKFKFMNLKPSIWEFLRYEINCKFGLTRIITNDDGTASLYGDELKNPFLLAKLGNKNKKLMAKKTGYKVESEKVESQNIIIMNESQVTVDIDSSTMEGTGECIL